MSKNTPSVPQVQRGFIRNRSASADDQAMISSSLLHHTAPTNLSADAAQSFRAEFEIAPCDSERGEFMIASLLKKLQLLLLSPRHDEEIKMGGHQKLIGACKSIVSALLLALAPGIANAIIVTLEPDDYGLGVPLANDYVTTAYLDGSLHGDPWSNVLTADDRSAYDPDYKAPTGTLTFGAFPFIAPFGEFGYTGFGIRFYQEVTRVTLLANSIYPPGDLAAVWAAFDNDGNEVAFGSAGGDRPASETFEIDIQVKGIRSLVLGGDTGISAIYFDHLTFEFDEMPGGSVVEPNIFLLLVTGLLLIALRHKLFVQPERARGNRAITK